RNRRGKPAGIFPMSSKRTTTSAPPGWRRNRLGPFTGRRHDGADLFWALMDCGVAIDRHLRAALINFHWHGGKAGFQFVPDRWGDFQRSARPQAREPQR